MAWGGHWRRQRAHRLQRRVQLHALLGRSREDSSKTKSAPRSAIPSKWDRHGPRSSRSSRAIAITSRRSPALFATGSRPATSPRHRRLREDLVTERSPFDRWIRGRRSRPELRSRNRATSCSRPSVVSRVIRGETSAATWFNALACSAILQGSRQRHRGRLREIQHHPERGGSLCLSASPRSEMWSARPLFPRRLGADSGTGRPGHGSIPAGRTLERRSGVFHCRVLVVALGADAGDRTAGWRVIHDDALSALPP